MKLRFICILIALFSISCSDIIVEEKCSDLVCTQNFAMIGVQFKTAAGDTIAVENFSAVLRRTEKPLPSADTVPNDNKQYYIATDGDKNLLRKEGDIIDVSATNPATNQTKTAEFVISGGKCSCHVEKISGPDTVVFD